MMDDLFPNRWNHDILCSFKIISCRIFRCSFRQPVLVPTGIKAYMEHDEYLQLANRSSNPLKRFLTLSNGVGVIDSAQSVRLFLYEHRLNQNLKIGT
jgi:dUTPase